MIYQTSEKCCIVICRNSLTGKYIKFLIQQNTDLTFTLNFRKQNQNQNQTQFTYRDIIDIWAEILEAISLQQQPPLDNREGSNNTRLGGTNVGMGARAPQQEHGISFSKRLGLQARTNGKQLLSHIKKLVSYGLICIDISERKTRTTKPRQIVKEKFARITEKGIMFLRIYQKMKEELIGSTIVPVSY